EKEEEHTEVQKDEEEVEEGPRDTIPPLQAKATPHNDETDDVIIVQAAGEKEEEEEKEQGKEQEEGEKAQKDVEEAVEKEEEEEEEIGFEATSAHASPIPHSTPLPDAMTPPSVHGTPLPLDTPAPQATPTSVQATPLAAASTPAAGGRPMARACRKLVFPATTTPVENDHDDNSFTAPSPFAFIPVEQHGDFNDVDPFAHRTNSATPEDDEGPALKRMRRQVEELREKVDEEAFARYREQQEAEEKMNQAVWSMIQEQQERAHAEYERDFERARADHFAQQVH
ncbi:hypothetical protein PRIPAC_84645, partial [Pristionchus pacificus]|uniref:Uncharacterized protein n=1 Tax=Pristionchus pacificus TaxID=54126 RepID=A0A2A6BV84_PRIPA